MLGAHIVAIYQWYPIFHLAFLFSFYEGTGFKVVIQFIWQSNRTLICDGNEVIGDNTNCAHSTRNGKWNSFRIVIELKSGQYALVGAKTFLIIYPYQGNAAYSLTDRLLQDFYLSKKWLKWAQLTLSTWISPKHSTLRTIAFCYSHS